MAGLSVLSRRGALLQICGIRSYIILPQPVQNLEVPDSYPENIEYPERRTLRPVNPIPHPLQGIQVKKMPRKLSDVRGPEETHTFLLHKQFGIRALSGGELKAGHFEMLVRGVNRRMDESRCFAIWRVDPPWKPRTKKPEHTRMGGGKPPIDHYVTPVKAGRIVIEFGGEITFKEAFPLLRPLAEKLPFKADVVSYEILEEEKKKNQQLEQENLNPFTFKYCIENNMFGCHKWISPYDRIWYGKYN